MRALLRRHHDGSVGMGQTTVNHSRRRPRVPGDSGRAPVLTLTAGAGVPGGKRVEGNEEKFAPGCPGAALPCRRRKGYTPPPSTDPPGRPPGKEPDGPAGAPPAPPVADDRSPPFGLAAGAVP